MKTKLTIIAVASILSGCSTITNGTTESISFSSDEPNTRLYINGAYRGTDSVTISVDRGEVHTATAKKKGCKPTTVTTDYEFQWLKSVFLNIPWDFGLVSIPTDLITGSAWKTEQANYMVTPVCEPIEENEEI